MNFEDVSKELARLVAVHKTHTENLLTLYEKSLSAQVAAYTAEAEKADAETKSKLAELETLIKKIGGKV
jgi:hypothetical protein